MVRRCYRLIIITIIIATPALSLSMSEDCLERWLRVGWGDNSVYLLPKPPAGHASSFS